MPVEIITQFHQLRPAAGLVRRTQLRHAASEAQHRAEKPLADPLGPWRNEIVTGVRRRAHIYRQSEFAEISQSIFARARRSVDHCTRLPVPTLRKEAGLPIPASSARSMPQERGVFEDRDVRHLEPSAATPPVNVERLASQVLHQIDRRIIARRERMGLV